MDNLTEPRNVIDHTAGSEWQVFPGDASWITATGNQAIREKLGDVRFLHQPGVILVHL